MAIPPALNPQDSPRTLGRAAARLASAEPLVDTRIMRLRSVWTVNLAGFPLGSVTGAGMLMLPSTVEMLVVAVPADQTGVATGMNTIMRTIGGALGSQIVAWKRALARVAPVGRPA